MLLLSAFYKRHAMQLRFAMMFSVTSLAGAFSGLLAFGIQHLNNKRGIAGWQWIFILVRHPLPFSLSFISPTPSPRREPSPSLLGSPCSTSYLPHPEISSYSLKRSARHIAETLPKIGVVTLTPMANMMRCLVGVKWRVYSRMHPMFFSLRFPCFSAA